MIINLVILEHKKLHIHLLKKKKKTHKAWRDFIIHKIQNKTKSWSDLWIHADPGRLMSSCIVTHKSDYLNVSECEK